ncbi:DUF4276 family protein [Algisphaera agarilytica]|uniref:DUF4276 family protein n=1 Tax=Algisphaera agarilytica TaxID=1385975 RepID=A0A7X0H967_9BACT|nr:DUF4276 family protein [Algisphaera agarilytica]MBB6431573.1 hypothetical protein [Algisphaera agarilytica]
MKLAILAEDVSDCDVLKNVVRLLEPGIGFSFKAKGYNGCSGLLRKGFRDMKSWHQQGVDRFLICHDADSNSPEDVCAKVKRDVIRKSGATCLSCIAVPVEEIEAWLVADESAIKTVLPKFNFSGHPNPESINSPKEWLEKKSRAQNGRPLYAHKVFNPRVAEVLDLSVVKKKCPSFEKFASEFSSII